MLFANMAKDIYAVSYRMRQELKHKITVIAALTLLCLLILGLCMHFILYPVRAVSTAMAPNIPADSVTLVTPLFGSPRRGDVVLLRGRSNWRPNPFVRAVNQVARFLTAQQWQPFSAPSAGVQQQLRRVVALPGDTIYLSNYDLYVKPKGETHFLTETQRFTEERRHKRPYTLGISAVPPHWDGELGAKSKMELLELGSDEYFVLGDNRLEAADSRLWGVVHRDDMRARAILLYFPLTKMRFF